MKKILREFKDFALRGNVMDLAVGVIVGAAFQSIVKSLTDDILSPLIGLVAKTDFNDLVLPILGVEIRYGSFLTAIINFVILAFVIFLLVKGMNKLAGLGKPKEAEAPAAPAPAPRLCPYCCTAVPDAATRCPHCTSELPAPSAGGTAE